MVRSPQTMLPAVLGVIGLAVALHAPAAMAQSAADEADVHFDAGVSAYRGNNFNAALRHFMQSNRLSPNFTSASNIGHAYRALGKNPEAYRWYSVALDIAENDGEEKLVADAMQTLKGGVVLFELTSDPPGAVVYLDRRSLGSVGITPVTIALDPGEYRFLFDLAKHRSFDTDAARFDKVGTVNGIDAQLDAITGKLIVTGDDQAEVRLQTEDAEALCTVPCEVDLNIGQYVLQITRPGHQSQPALIEILEGLTAEVVASPEPISTSLRVDANVDSALVTVDGADVGFTPAIVQLPVGARVIGVSAPGYDEVSFSVDAEQGVPIDLGIVKLQPRQVVSLASRVEEDKFTAPSSISVVSRKEIQRFGYPTLAEALRGVRGLSVVNADLSSLVMVRGVGTAANRGTQTKVLRNGVAQTDQLVGQQYLFSRSDNVGGIEVQRGSGSVLYGSGALTGLVSIQDRGRVTEPTATGRIGVFGTEGRADAFGGWGDQDSGVTLAVGGVRGDGDATVIQDVPTGQDGFRDVGVENFNPWRGLSVDGRAYADDLEVWGSWSRDRVEATTGVEGAIYEDPRNRGNNPSVLEQITVGATYAPTLSDTTSLSLSAHYRARVGDEKATWRRPVLDTELLIDVERTTRARWVGGNAQIVSTPIEGLRIVAGFEGYRSIELSLEQTNTVRPSDAPASFDFSSAQAVYAAYAVADYQPVPAFKLSGGVRLDSWFAFGAQINPRLVAMVLPTEDDVVKLMVGRAFRAPVLFEQKYFVESLSIPALDLQPESGWSYELEYTHRMGAWTVLGSGWGASYTNTILSELDPDIVLSRYKNAGRATVLGFDTELRREFWDDWMVSAWYSYQVPKVTDAAGTTVAAPEQPRHLAAAKIVAPIASPGLSVATRVVYEDARPNRSASEGTVDPAVLADLIFSGENRTGTVGWRAGAYNVLDVNYSTATANSTASATVPQTTGRTFMASLVLRGRIKKDTSTK